MAKMVSKIMVKKTFRFAFRNYIRNLRTKLATKNDFIILPLLNSNRFGEGTSFARENSLIWGSNGAEIFSGSNREQDDEAALTWAAVDRLPTFDRLKKGILIASGGEASEIDVKDLGLQERKELIKRLVKTDEGDNEKFLLKLKRRIDRVGISVPTIEVRFEHLKVDGETYVGSRALPTFFNFYINMLEGLLSSLHIPGTHKKRQVHILKDVSGIIKPSRMTLLLGPPISGKTTLMLALAGKLNPTLESSGRVTYNGHELNEFIPQRTAAYISQHDLHIGEMTVRETFAFAARCQGVGTRYDLLAELLRREKAAHIQPDPDIDVYMKAAATEGVEANVVTDYILKILGLDGCADSIVGDEMLRGISGGQRKRVTMGEMLVGPAKALFMDEISTGLDSSTTYQVVRSIKNFVHILGGTALITLLQPAPETYNLFDDIILLSEGRIVYQGPREQVLEFFEYMGFRCPRRKGVADFLQEVMSRKDQKQYWANKEIPYRFITVKEFSQASQSFYIGRFLQNELATPFNKASNHPAALTTKKYGVSKMELYKACFSRELLLFKRHSFIHIFRMAQIAVLTFIAMTVFFRSTMHRDSVTDGRIFEGAMYYAVGMVIFTGFVEISTTFVTLSVFYKQRDLLFFPAWAFALPNWVLKLPVAFIEAAIVVFPAYYVIGYDPNVERLFRQYLVLLLAKLMSSGLFRLLAAISRSMIVANILTSFVMLFALSLNGFVIPRDYIKKWWIWGFWISPTMYLQNALEVNEFHGNSWSHVPPNSTEPLGIQVLKSRGFFAEAYWYWIGVGATCGFTLLFNCLYTLAITFLDSYDTPQAVIQQGPDGEEQGTSSQQTITETEDDMRNNSTLSSIGSRRKGMVLPFEPHSITFDEIIYSVDMPQEMKRQGVSNDKLVLLKGLSGSFRPGVLTALMGVSGAGKTTLMDVLAGRKTSGYIEGNITISGYPKKQDTFARISGYCEQNDIHSPHVTVHESLLYSAWLRLPAEVDTGTRKMFIEEVMNIMELVPLRHALVGLPRKNGLSTEQRKRLTIAVELVANPSIIFMDEPTSGLDARAAAIVMRTVRNTVDTGRTVVCTIHQPSIDIFEAFDELFLMKRGGQEIYVGPLGHHCCNLIDYFEAIQGIEKINDGYNPATWMLEVTTSAQEEALGVDFADVYKNSEPYRRNKALIKDLSKPAPGSRELYFPSKYSQPFITQCLACLWKQRQSYWRNTAYTAVRLFTTAVIALLIGSLYWDLGSKTRKKEDLFNAMASMYSAIILLGNSNSAAVQPVVAVERTVLYRERAAGMYSALAYALAQVLIEIPYVFAQAVTYGVIVYAMIGFEWTAAKFFWYLFFMYFTLLYYTFYGMMAVALTPNLSISTITSAAFYALWNLFSGFTIPRTRMPVWWSWYVYLCPMAWTLYGLLTTQFGDIKDTLESGETVEHFLRDYFGFRRDLVGAVAGVVFGLAVLFAFAFTVAIKIFNFQKR